MKIAAFQALVPKKSLLKETFGNLNTTEFYQRLDQQYKRKAEAFWIMRISSPSGDRLGIISLVDVIDSGTKILPHEDTIPKKISKTRKLLREHGAQINPIMLLFKRRPGLQQFMEEVVNIRPADLAYNNNNTAYEFWRLNDRVSVHFFQNYFASIDTVYIADGHHRFAAQAEIFKENPSDANRFLLAALIPITEMQIGSYYRVVKTAKDVNELHTQLAQFLDIQPYENGVGDISMHSLNGSLSLSLRKSEKEALDSPQVKSITTLHDHIFPAVFDIDMEANAPQIKYMQANGSIESTIAELKEGQYLFETSNIPLEIFVKLTEAGIKLPPKSTLFKPRMQKGLIVHQPHFRNAQAVS